MDCAPRECIGKNVLFDSDSGATFAHVVDIIKFNTVQGPREAFIVDNMVVRTSGQIRIFQNQRRVLHIDKLEMRNFVSGRSFNELMEAGELSDELFLQILGADENRPLTAFELSGQLKGGWNE